jgi:outer membrane protein TolC
MPQRSFLRAAPAAFLLLAIARDVWAAAVEPAGSPLTLADCVRLAEAAPSPARVAERQTDIARARLDLARAGLLPRLSIFAGLHPQQRRPRQPRGR